MDRRMQHIHDPVNLHLFTVESALAAIERSKSSGGGVLRELLESPEYLKAHGLVSPEDMEHMKALCEGPPENTKP